MKKVTYLLLIISLHAFSQTRLLDSLKKQISIVKKIDTTSINTRITYQMQSFQANPSDSTLLDFTEKTLRQSNELKYDRGRAIANQHIGIIYYFFRSEPLKALEYFQKSLKIIDKKPYLLSLTPGSLANIGIIYMEQGDYNDALKIYRRMYKKFNRNTIIEQYLANAFGNLNQLDSAIFYFNKAIGKAKILKKPVFEANNLSNLSLILVKKNEPKEAKIAIEKALNLVKKHHIKLVVNAIYTNAIEVYLLNNEYNLVEYYANKILKSPNLRNNIFMQKNIYATLYDVYKTQKKYKKSLKAHEQFKRLNDSLIDIDKRIEFTKKDLNFKSERKELLAKTEISNQKFISKIYLVSGSVSVLAIGLFFFLVNQKRKVTIIAKESEFKKNLAESKLIALRTQLNPHFIFNALNSINQYIISHSIEDASTYLIKFSALMRTILHNSDKNWISLHDEIEMMKVYVDIESLRLKNSIQLSIKINDDIDTENTLVPSLFIQPFIENSIEHGIFKIDHQGVISIIIKKEGEEKLICIVEDNGIGRNENQSKNTSYKPMGIQIAKERINRINQLINNKVFFKIEDLNQGLRVSITIPNKTIF